MGFREIVRDDGGISPVVGVVITILLAVLASTVFVDVGRSAQQDVPQASFGFTFENNGSYEPDNMEFPGSSIYWLAPSGEYTADNLTIVHEGGDAIDSENLLIQMEGTEFKYVKRPSGDLGGASYKQERTLAEMGGPTEIAAGQRITITTLMVDVYNRAPAPREMDAATVRVVYRSDSGDTSVILAEWTGPEV